MSDAEDGNHPICVIDLIKDSIITDANAPSIPLSFEFLYTGRARSITQGENPEIDTLKE